MLRTSVFRCRSHKLFSSRAKRLSIHPDPMVTLCPHRAKKLHPSRASHLALTHYRGGCPVPRVLSLSQRQLIQYTLTYCTNLWNRFHVFLAFTNCLHSWQTIAFYSLQTIKPRQFAIFVLLRIVIEYFWRRKIYVPVTRGPVFLYAWY